MPVSFHLSCSFCFVTFFHLPPGRLYLAIVSIPPCALFCGLDSRRSSIHLSLPAVPFKLGHYWSLLPFSVSLWATNRLLLVAGLGPGPNVTSGAVFNTGGGVSHLLMIAGPQVVSIRPISVMS